MCLSCWPWVKLSWAVTCKHCHPRILTLKTFAFSQLEPLMGGVLPSGQLSIGPSVDLRFLFKEILFNNYRYFPFTIWSATFNFLLKNPILFSIASFSLVFSCPFLFLFILWMIWFPHNIFFHPSMNQVYQAWLCLAVKMRLDVKFSRMATNHIICRIAMWCIFCPFLLY